MPLQKPDYQLQFDLELPEETGDRGPETGFVTPEEARLRSEAARAVLEGEAGFTWMAEYAKLRDGGWNWRVAAYIAWASSPRANRMPRTQDELARTHLGLTSDRAINTWRRKNPVIDETVALLQAAPLWEHRAEIYEALISVATSHEYKGHNDRKLALELLGDYIPAAKLEAILKQKGAGNDPDVEDESKLISIERAVTEIRGDKDEEDDDAAGSD
jgi:hypothetical protein